MDEVDGDHALSGWLWKAGEVGLVDASLIVSSHGRGMRHIFDAVYISIDESRY